MNVPSVKRTRIPLSLSLNWVQSLLSVGELDGQESADAAMLDNGVFICCFKLEHQQNEKRKINESILLLLFLYRVS